MRAGSAYFVGMNNATTTETKTNKGNEMGKATKVRKGWYKIGIFHIVQTERCNALNRGLDWVVVTGEDNARSIFHGASRFNYYDIFNRLSDAIACIDDGCIDVEDNPYTNR